MTRKSTVTTAKLLANVWASGNPRNRQWPGPSQKIAVQDSDLKCMFNFKLISSIAKPISRHFKLRGCIPSCWARFFGQVYCGERVSRRADSCDLLHIDSCRRDQLTVSPCHHQEYRKFSRRGSQRVCRSGNYANAGTGGTVIAT